MNATSNSGKKRKNGRGKGAQIREGRRGERETEKIEKEGREAETAGISVCVTPALSPHYSERKGSILMLVGLKAEGWPSATATLFAVHAAES